MGREEHCPAEPTDHPEEGTLTAWSDQCQYISNYDNFRKVLMLWPCSHADHPGGYQPWRNPRTQCPQRYDLIVFHVLCGRLRRDFDLVELIKYVIKQGWPLSNEGEEFAVKMGLSSSEPPLASDPLFLSEPDYPTPILALCRSLWELHNKGKEWISAAELEINGYRGTKPSVLRKRHQEFKQVIEVNEITPKLFTYRIRF